VIYKEDKTDMLSILLMEIRQLIHRRNKFRK